MVGDIVAKYESGNKGCLTISTGRGDRGGKSYGRYQLALKTGTLNKFLISSGYIDKFKGVVLASPRFDLIWKNLCQMDPKFPVAQHEFIKNTHYVPFVNRLKSKTGFNAPAHSSAFQEACWSASIQYGPRSGIIINAIKRLSVDSPDRLLIQKIYQYKYKKVNKYFWRCSRVVRNSVRRRVINEEKDILRML